MTNKTVIQREIRDYCELNGIENIDDFIWKCTVQGFNIIKYGVSPSDNIKREEEVPKKKVGRPKKSEAKKSEEVIKETPEKKVEKVKVTKRKIKVINND